MPSQSNPLTADKVPSTPEQFDIANVIADDLRELGAEDVEVDEHAYVTAHWPASAGSEDKPCLGFCCHIDTAWQSVGSPVHPEVKHYEGGKLVIGGVAKSGNKDDPDSDQPEKPKTRLKL